MLSKNLENSLSYGIVYKFWKKSRVYYTLSISRGPMPPPPWIRHWKRHTNIVNTPSPLPSLPHTALHISVTGRCYSPNNVFRSCTETLCTPAKLVIFQDLPLTCSGLLAQYWLGVQYIFIEIQEYIQLYNTIQYIIHNIQKKQYI